MWATAASPAYLDLVALATIADVVPLVDENRALAIAGLRRLATTTRPGLRALMRAAHVDPAAVDEGAVGFRLAPRINAAGRLGRPTAALELLLTDDEGEASRLASELEELNHERQSVEERILREASAAIESWPEARKRRHGYVVAGESWHEGVIGIVASRLVERYHRPVVLIAGAEGDWKGSGRSIPAFDLHAGLAACSGLLERFGGHRAAAGLSIRPDAVDAFADAFGAHADEHLTDLDLRAVTIVDAVVPGTALTLGLCAELRRLEPFGLGNPGVTLLVAGCELAELATVGEGKHLRFRVRDRGRPARHCNRVRPGLQARPLSAGGTLRRCVPPSGEHLERDDRSATRRPADLRDARPVRRAPRALRRGVANEEAEPGSKGGTRRARSGERRGRRLAEPARVGDLPRADRGRPARG